MNVKKHLLSEIIFFITLFIFIEEITIFDIIYPIIFGTSFPDMDVLIRSHRNILFHSIIIPFIIWIVYPTLFFNLFVIAVGIHLLCDSKWWSQHGLKRGTFCAIYLPNKRLTAKKSALWYMCNFITSFVILLLQLWIYLF